MSVEEKFHAAVNVIRSLPKDGPYQPSQDMMLKFYGLYKQATEGPCNDPKPAFYEVVKGYKWRAWKNFGSMSKTDAMGTYVDELKKIVETMSYTENVAKFMDALGPFYEYIDLLGLRKSDSNHNLKDIPDAIKGDSAADIEATGGEAPLCNGNREQLSVNGEKESEVSSEEDLGNHIPESEDKGSDSTSDEDSAAKVNGFVKVSYPVEENDKETNIPLNESASLSSLVYFSSNDIAKKLLSDTDSDEEYSEPVEAPEFLLQNKSTGKDSDAHMNSSSEHHHQQEINHASDGRVACLPKVFTRGGGDAGNPSNFNKTAIGRGGRSPRHFPPSQFTGMPGQLTRRDDLLPGGRGGGDGRRGPPRDWDQDPPQSVSEDINSQLVLILQKIHRDLQGILIRLNSLESQAFGQHQQTCHTCQRRLIQTSEKNWWPFPELSPRSTFFLLTWPLILKGFLKLLVFIRAKRRNR